MAIAADNGCMITLLLFVVAVAAMVGMGLLAARYGADSRHTDPRDLRHSWY
jgi:hypothetical protein